MSGISVSEDAINMYYYLKAKSSVSIMEVASRHSQRCNVCSSALKVLMHAAVSMGNLDDQ